ncbi:MAG: hypothetical protein KGL39_41460 [Patescibacteria group bacterium]|nr:hypothetical protein [Patescibacteria group bacterium]
MAATAEKECSMTTHSPEHIERVTKAICMAITDRPDDDFMTYYAPLAIAALDAMAEIQAEKDERLRFFERLFTICTAETPVVCAPNDKVAGGKLIVEQKYFDSKLCSSSDIIRKAVEAEREACVAAIRSRADGSYSECGCEEAAEAIQEAIVAIRARSKEV